MSTRANKSRASAVGAVSIATETAKYRTKYKELKRKVREMEAENDRLHIKTLRVKRRIQRLRLERAILYERLEGELGTLTLSADGQPATASSSRPPPIAAEQSETDEGKRITIKSNGAGE